MTKLLLVLVPVLVLIAPAASAAVHHPPRYPVVYVEDHSGGAWHVHQAVRAWGSGLRYGHCRTGAGCAVVWTANQGYNHDYRGTTWSCVHPGAVDCTATVLLNTWRWHRLTPLRRYATTLHELGHVLGLGHDYGTGVMYPVCDGCRGRHAHVSRFERRELTRIY